MNNNNQRRKAAELLRQCAREANCKNDELLNILRSETKRTGGQLRDEGPSDDKGAMLPTPENLGSAFTTGSHFLRCTCNLCEPPPRNSRLETTSSEDAAWVCPRKERLEDLAILVLCGCLYISRHPEFVQADRLVDFATDESLSTDKIADNIFGRLATQPGHCALCETRTSNNPVIWIPVDHLRDVCNRCRVRAFRDAFDLKKSVLRVHDMKEDGTVFDPEALQDMSKKNMPFINLTALNSIKPSSENPKFYSSKIHPDYANPKWNESEVETKYINAAKKEVSIALHMSNHPNVAKLLFAFRDVGADFEVIELLYKRHYCSLDMIASGTRELPRGTNSKNTVTNFTDHFLWKAMLKVVSAVVNVHEQRQPCGPLDIKPANILVDKDDNEGVILYLTDFGHAALSIAHPATAEYAPPDTQRGLNVGSQSVGYDIWSMACVLLQIIVFIDTDFEKSSWESFQSNLRRESSSPAFWYLGSEGPQLRSAVEHKLTELEKQWQPRVLAIIRKLRQMLSIEASSRGTMRECLEEFQRPIESRWPTGQDQMNCGCEGWSIFRSNLSLQEQTPARIGVYRDESKALLFAQPGGSYKHEKITIDLNLHGRESMMDSSECRSISFTSANFFAKAEDGTTTLILRSKNLLQNYSLHFNHMNQYRQFITLVTRQRILAISGDVTDYSGQTDFLIQACVAKKIFKRSRFSDGKAQIWKLLEDGEYDEEYNRCSEEGTPQRSSLNMPHRYTRENIPTDCKIVLWIHNENREKVCIVVDVGEDTWEFDQSQSMDECLTIKRKSLLNRTNSSKLRAAILSAVHGDSRLSEPVPFIPIDPAQLQKELKQDVISHLTLTFQSQEGKPESPNLPWFDSDN
ncbi:hypothetical protein CCUS01_10723 [Colletotrichum cuscutae]|uniref:Protein kinase domain-containing protein n=1 Tax=Colletotrichum cuscutae TaxID=1209917 RepID=A0AAI9UAY3_9PEZI|nr:hypothetical protein CCUS01_10723 [Colletotrichum cuscutae]